MINLKEIGHRVRLRRQKLHITIEKLAELSNVSVSLVSLLERGKLEDIHFNNLCNIANSLNVDLFYLISDDNERNMELRQLENEILRFPLDKQHKIIQSIMYLLNLS